MSQATSSIPDFRISDQTLFFAEDINPWYDRCVTWLKSPDDQPESLLIIAALRSRIKMLQKVNASASSAAAAAAYGLSLSALQEAKDIILRRLGTLTPELPLDDSPFEELETPSRGESPEQSAMAAAIQAFQEEPPLLARSSPSHAAESVANAPTQEIAEESLAVKASHPSEEPVSARAPPTTEAVVANTPPPAEPVAEAEQIAPKTISETLSSMLTRATSFASSAFANLKTEQPKYEQLKKKLFEILHEIKICRQAYSFQKDGLSSSKAKEQIKKMQQDLQTLSIRSLPTSKERKELVTYLELTELRLATLEKDSLAPEKLMELATDLSDQINTVTNSFYTDDKTFVDLLRNYRQFRLEYHSLKDSQYFSFAGLSGEKPTLQFANIEKALSELAELCISSLKKSGASTWNAYLPGSLLLEQALLDLED